MTDHARPPAGSDFHRFARLVHLMRSAQREYFRTRSGTALSQSKDLERRVDIATGWILATREHSPCLAGFLSDPHADGTDFLDTDPEDDAAAGESGLTGAYGSARPTGRRVPLRRKRQ